jgi:hypothetical protein
MKRIERRLNAFIDPIESGWGVTTNPIDSIV